MLINKERKWLKKAHPGIIERQVHFEFHALCIEFPQREDHEIRRT